MAESVAGCEEINSEAKERKRKHNFSVYEIGVITENVKNHHETIQSKLTNNIKKETKEIWEEITRAVNAYLLFLFESPNFMLTRPCARVNLCPGGFSCGIKLDGLSNLKYC